MEPIFDTPSRILRRLAAQAALGLALVPPGITMAFYGLAGGDWSREFTAGAAMRFCLLIVFVEAVLFAPLIAIRTLSWVRALHSTLEELQRLAVEDPLTGLLNRRGFDTRARAGVAEAEKRHAPVAALLIDLDHFKRVNDQFGHAFGDHVLLRLADLLRAEAKTRTDVILGRQGGEEFAILMPGRSADEAHRFAEDLIASFSAQPIECGGARASLSMSVGVAQTHGSDYSVSRLLSRADEALYEAKRGGRNRVAREPAPNRAA